MLQNYFKIAWRNLLKSKQHSLINLIGLTIGLTGCLLIGVFVWDEWQFDKYHPDGERTYRIYTERGGGEGPPFWASTSPAFSPTMKADFPEVEQTLRLFQIRSKQLFKKDENSYIFPVISRKIVSYAEVYFPGCGISPSYHIYSADHSCNTV